ncbi:hypothetical protein [Hymenobacter algoricola]
MSDPVPASVADSPGLIITYDEAFQYVQDWLNSFMHGDLKPWVETQQLNYSMVINLRNGRIPRPMPRLIRKIMADLGFDLQAKRVKQNDRFVAEFLLTDAQQIKIFRAQRPA